MPPFIAVVGLFSLGFVCAKCSPPGVFKNVAKKTMEAGAQVAGGVKSFTSGVTEDIEDVQAESDYEKKQVAEVSSSAKVKAEKV